MAKEVKTPYHQALQAERAALLAKHGIKLVNLGADDGHAWRSPRLIPANVLARLAKLDRLLQVASQGWGWDTWIHQQTYQGRKRGRSDRSMGYPSQWKQGLKFFDKLLAV